MISFQPDICLPDDDAGLGAWLIGHYREHLILAQKCLALSPSVIVPNYDILAWRKETELIKQWLQSHESIHQVLRSACNVTGSDLSLVDFNDSEEILDWMGDHATEHQNFRTVLGVM